jgi:hypothetical protein
MFDTTYNKPRLELLTGIGLQGLDPNFHDVSSSGETPLTIAASLEAVDVVVALVEVCCVCVCYRIYNLSILSSTYQYPSFFSGGRKNPVPLN